MIKTIDEFRGANFFLSNFYPLPFPMVIDGKEFATSEHAYQCYKARTPDAFEYIRRSPTAREAKRIGCHLIAPVENWDDKKSDIMLKVLRVKFAERGLRTLLINTADALLIEGNNWHDLYWGKCRCAEHKGYGKNILGKLLMQVRDELGGDAVRL